MQQLYEFLLHCFTGLDVSLCAAAVEGVANTSDPMGKVL